jgi:NAD(P)H-hydrate repair Nnr-like enzyme with NAD(P)H-hydrate dehydratase domain
MTELLPTLLERNPLPPVGGDKHDRGTAVIVAGTERCPGAAILAATAALRAGAGRVQIITAPRWRSASRSPCPRPT